MPDLLDAEALVCDVLRLGVDGHVPTVTVVDELPADWAQRLPIVRAHRWGGAAIDLEFLDRAQLQLDLFAATRTGVIALGSTCRSALFRAWRQQIQTAHGAIGSLTETQAPIEAPGAHQLVGVHHFQASYELYLSP